MSEDAIVDGFPMEAKVEFSVEEDTEVADGVRFKGYGNVFI